MLPQIILDVNNVKQSKLFIRYRIHKNKTKSYIIVKILHFDTLCSNLKLYYVNTVLY